MSTIEIFLDNYTNVAYPGQTLAGRVECNFNKQKNMRAIRIRFKGKSETNWTESESYYDHSTKKHKTRHVHYSGHESYFEEEYNLVQGGENFSLPPGRHSYPFSYILPQQLPSSFEGEYGHVRYSIKATVDRPWKIDYENKVILNVLSPLDLNYVPEAREPVNQSVDKHLCCCWCKSGPLTFDISLPATGYVPGQEVNVGAYVQNMSNVSAECVKFKIVKEIEFIAHYPSTRRRYDSALVAECRDGGIGAHGEKSWTSVLVIPENGHYPNLRPCSLINMHYEFKAKVVLPCPHANLDQTCNFTIGDVPLSGLNTAILGPPPVHELPLPSYNSFPMPASGATAPPPPESAPLLPGSASPYPGGDTKYPPGGSAPYPIGGPPGAFGVAPYPPAAAPYPNGEASSQPGGAPYPPAAAPYPPAAAPYPPAAAPYPPAAAPYPNGEASSQPGGAPYPAGGAPYPAGGSSYPSGGAPYPSGGAPYPSGAAPDPQSAGSQSEPFKGFSAASAPPSYDEAKKLKNEKPE